MNRFDNILNDIGDENRKEYDDKLKRDKKLNEDINSSKKIYYPIIKSALEDFKSITKKFSKYDVIGLEYNTLFNTLKRKNVSGWGFGNYNHTSIETMEVRCYFLTNNMKFYKNRSYNTLYEPLSEEKMVECIFDALPWALYDVYQRTGSIPKLATTVNNEIENAVNKIIKNMADKKYEDAINAYFEVAIKKYL